MALCTHTVLACQRFLTKQRFPLPLQFYHLFDLLSNSDHMGQIYYLCRCCAVQWVHKCCSSNQVLFRSSMWDIQVFLWSILNGKCYHTRYRIRVARFFTEHNLEQTWHERFIFNRGPGSILGLCVYSGAMSSIYEKVCNGNTSCSSVKLVYKVNPTTTRKNVQLVFRIQLQY